MDTFFNQNSATSGNDPDPQQILKQIEQRLEASEARTRCLMDTLPQIIWLAQVDGAMTSFNAPWYEYTGLTAVESLNWAFLRAIHPNDRDRLIASWNLLSKTPHSQLVECRILGSDGIYRWFIGKRTAVLGVSGQLLEWVGTYTPKEQLEQYAIASEQERTTVNPVEGRSSKHLIALTSQLTHSQEREQAPFNTANLTQQRRRHRIAKELSQAIVWEAEAKTLQFTFVSPSAERVLGYPAQEWIGEPNFWENLIHPDDRQWAVTLCRKKMFQSRDYELEYRCLTADRRVIWLRDRACVVRDDQGQVHKRRGLMVDITLAKQAEAELQIRMRQQATVAQLGRTALLGTEVSTLMNESVSLVAQTLAVEYCNVLELLPDGNTLRLQAGVGWQPGLVGQLTIEASANTQAGYTLQVHQPVIVEDLRRETRFPGSRLLHDHNIVSGLSVAIEATTKTDRSDSSDGNTPVRFFGVLGVHATKRRTFSQSDVDFLQAVANVLAAAIEYQHVHNALNECVTLLHQTTKALEKRNWELEQFTYVASHDLKAPLRAIANLSEWIEEDLSEQLNEENRQQMNLMRGRVHRLEALIDGLLQYSRMERFKSEPEQIEVEVLLRQVIDSLRPSEQFTIEIAPGMPTLVTDRLRLQQVFSHLIDNAIKHHPQPNGTVKISVREHPDAYEFAVADDGVGIAPQFHERIFVIFQTLQPRDRLETTGVGLAIAKRIVESQGGTIRVESQEGQGATFYFTLPKPLSCSGATKNQEP